MKSDMGSTEENTSTVLGDGTRLERARAGVNAVRRCAAKISREAGKGKEARTENGQESWSALTRGWRG
jgi:hypothetical protein